MSFETVEFGQRDADILLVQMVDDHDLEFIEKEVSLIRELTGGRDFCLKAVKVKSWNKDLSPWPAPAVFGNEDFGDGAGETLSFLLDEVIPTKADGTSGNPGSAADMLRPGRSVYLGGYSLAGLFALWAGYQTDRFDGIAAASPSVWFPGFTQYMRDNRIQAGRVYLSLGDREERTKNPVMSRVGEAIREALAVLEGEGKECILEWNKGNHFKDADLRTAKAFAWLISKD